jgi:hypothetical protein
MGTLKIDIKEKIQKMTASQIILAMVKGLEKPITQVRMDTYGAVKNEVCYGCAATNMICHLAKIDEKLFLKANPSNTMKYFFSTLRESIFIDDFESAIDRLRRGSVAQYNVQARLLGIATIEKDDNLLLPYLDDNYTKEQLAVYKQLAKYNKVSKTK